MNTRKALISISLAGLLISGYLFIVYVTPVPLICDSTGGCEIIRLSKYASFIGIPTPFYGVVFYAALGILAALERYNLVRWLTLIGLGTSIGLTYISSFVIGAYCLWCLASALLSILAFIIAWMPQRPREPQVATDASELEPA